MFFSLFISVSFLVRFHACSPAKLRFYSETDKGNRGKLRKEWTLSHVFTDFDPSIWPPERKKINLLPFGRIWEGTKNGFFLVKKEVFDSLDVRARSWGRTSIPPNTVRLYPLWTYYQGTLGRTSITLVTGNPCRFKFQVGVFLHENPIFMPIPRSVLWISHNLFSATFCQDFRVSRNHGRLPHLGPSTPLFRKKKLKGWHSSISTFTPACRYEIMSPLSGLNALWFNPSPLTHTLRHHFA